MKTKTDYFVAFLITLGILSIVYLVSGCKKETTPEQPKPTYIVSMYSIGKVSGTQYTKNGLACLYQVECTTGDNVSIYSTGSDTISAKIYIRTKLHSDSLVAIGTGYKQAWASYTFK